MSENPPPPAPIPLENRVVGEGRRRIWGLESLSLSNLALEACSLSVLAPVCLRACPWGCP